MKLALAINLVLAFAGTASAVASAALSVPEPLSLVLWGFVLIALSGTLRSRPAPRTNLSVDRAVPQHEQRIAGVGSTLARPA
jgi:hypothetical protein